MSTEKPYGERNPIKKKRVGEALHGSTISASRILQDMMLDKTNEYALEGQRYYKGEVLYAYTDAQGAVHVKARIPEINILPLPTSLPEANDSKADADWATISLYPTFVAFNAQVSQMGLPSPGEIVYLDYEHVLTFDGPLYMGPVNIGAMPVPEAAHPDINNLDWSSATPFDWTTFSTAPWAAGPGVTPEKKYSLCVWWDGGINSIMRSDIQAKLKAAGIAKIQFIIEPFRSFNGQSYKQRFGRDYSLKVSQERIKKAIDVCIRLGIEHSFMTYPYPDPAAVKASGEKIKNLIQYLKSFGNQYLPQRIELDLEENWHHNKASGKLTLQQLKERDSFLIMTMRTALANTGVALGANFIHWTLSSKSKKGRSCVQNIINKCDSWTVQAYADNLHGGLPNRINIPVQKADTYAAAAGTKAVHLGLSGYGQTPNRGKWAGKVFGAPQENLALSLTTVTQTNPKPREFWYWSSKHIFGTGRTGGSFNKYVYSFFVNFAKLRIDELNSNVSKSTGAP